MSTVQVIQLARGIQRESGEQNTASYPYLVTCAATELAAELATIGTAPQYVVMSNGNALPLNDLQTKSVGCDPSGNLIYNVTVGYGTQSNQQQTVVQFDTDGGTQKITNSISTVLLKVPTALPLLPATLMRSPCAA